MNYVNADSFTINRARKKRGLVQQMEAPDSDIYEAILKKQQAKAAVKPPSTKKTKTPKSPKKKGRKRVIWVKPYRDYPTYVYLMSVVGTSFYKIGIAKKPEQRLNDIQAANPMQVVIITRQLYTTFADALKVERYLHETYQTSHVRREWFDLPSTKATKITLFLQENKEPHKL